MRRQWKDGWMDGRTDGREGWMDGYRCTMQAFMNKQAIEGVKQRF